MIPKDHAKQPVTVCVLTANDDRTFTAVTYKFNTNTHVRTEIRRKEYRLATVEDQQLHTDGKLEGKTLVSYEPDNFKPFLLVEIPDGT